MCKVIEDLIEEEREETKSEIALRMLKAGKYPLEEIVEFSDLPLEEIKKLQAAHNL